MDCSEAEVLIGMKQHGALDGARAAALEEHLAACPGCRAFAETTQTMEGTLAMNASNAAQSMNPDELARIVQKKIRDSRLLAWLLPSNPRNLGVRAGWALAALNVAVLSSIVFASDDLATGLFAALAGAGAQLLIVFAIGLPQHRKRAAELALVRSDAEFRAFLQRDEAERVRAVRWMRRAPLYVIGIIIALMGAAVELGMVFDRAHTLGLAAVGIGLCFAVIVPMWRREQRRLRDARSRGELV